MFADWSLRKQMVSSVGMIQSKVFDFIRTFSDAYQSFSRFYLFYINNSSLSSPQHSIELFFHFISEHLSNFNERIHTSLSTLFAWYDAWISLHSPMITICWQPMIFALGCWQSIKVIVSIFSSESYFHIVSPAWVRSENSCFPPPSLSLWSFEVR